MCKLNKIICFSLSRFPFLPSVSDCLFWFLYSSFSPSFPLFLSLSGSPWATPKPWLEKGSAVSSTGKTFSICAIYRCRHHYQVLQVSSLPLWSFLPHTPTSSIPAFHPTSLNPITPFSHAHRANSRHVAQFNRVAYTLSVARYPAEGFNEQKLCCLTNVISPYIPNSNRSFISFLSSGLQLTHHHPSPPYPPRHLASMQAGRRTRRMPKGLRGREKNS